MASGTIADILDQTATRPGRAYLRDTAGTVLSVGDVAALTQTSAG